MTLRLVLVSLVAALGLTIPGAPMIENWVASTQNWMNARFADWDTRNPHVADYVIVSDFYDAGQFASRPAISDIPASRPAPSPSPTERLETLGAAASSNPSSTPVLLHDINATAVHQVSIARKTQVFEPIEVAERLRSGFAERLHRMNEGIGSVPPRILKAVSSRAYAEPIALAQYVYQGIGGKLNSLEEGMRNVRGQLTRWANSRRVLEPRRVFEDLYGGSAPRRQHKLEVAVANPPLPVPAALTSAKVVALSFGVMESCPNLYFAGKLKLPAPKAVVTATAAQPTAPVAKVTAKAPAPTAQPTAPVAKVTAKASAPTAQPTAPVAKVAPKSPAPAVQPTAPVAKVAPKSPAPAV
ncbi:MAG: hypothetical protein ACP5XB_29190, partial [Isosphaeraceae bacterium]